jgi:hypothetical protein
MQKMHILILQLASTMLRTYCGLKLVTRFCALCLAGHCREFITWIFVHCCNLRHVHTCSNIMITLLN